MFRVNVNCRNSLFSALVQLMHLVITALRRTSIFFTNNPLLVTIIATTLKTQAAPADLQSWYLFHCEEVQRAQTWVNYYIGAASQYGNCKEYSNLVEQWKIYAINQQQWATYCYEQLCRGSVAQVEAPLRFEKSPNHASHFKHQSPFQARPNGGSENVALITMRSGYAFGLNSLPPVIHRTIAAGNALQKKPYILGGGHQKLEDYGYDCSSAVSFVLIKAGLLNRIFNTQHLKDYGEPGPGKFITLWVKPGVHVFMTICGLRLDTSGGSIAQGPRWRTSERLYTGFTPRHPLGL